MTTAGLRVLVVNQHGENRGDEAALRAMVRGIDACYPGSTFTVLTQFRDRDLRLRFDEQDVRFETMMVPPVEAARLGACAMVAALRIPFGLLLSGRTARIMDAYQSADVVITAPGGPYFGDIYVNHELVHWFYIYLARVHRRPVFQYAPSCGPFRIGPMNWLRRRFYRWIDVLVVREEISREHLQRLLGPSAQVHLTIDAAVQDERPAATRDEYFGADRARLRDRFLVAVTLQRYAFPGDAHPAARQAAYERAVLACLEHLAERTSCHLLFFPQLYGAVHSDAAFHRYLGGRLPAGVSWELVDPALDSDRQRALFGMTDFCVASRYHPQIFATTQGVPGLFIAYEHKQSGYLRQLGLERFLFDIRALDESKMKSAIDEALATRDVLADGLRARVPALRHLARRTNDLLVELLSRPHRYDSAALSTARRSA